MSNQSEIVGEKLRGLQIGWLLKF